MAGLVELWQVTVCQARVETTPVPDNSPFRNQDLRSSAGPRQHPTTPVISGQHLRPPSRPPLSPGDARFRSEPPDLRWPRTVPDSERSPPGNEGNPLNKRRVFALPSHPHQLQSPQQRPAFESLPLRFALFPPTPPSGSSGIGACGPGRGRALAGLWGGRPQDPARSRAWWPPPRSRGGV